MNPEPQASRPSPWSLDWREALMAALITWFAFNLVAPFTVTGLWIMALCVEVIGDADAFTWWNPLLSLAPVWVILAIFIPLLALPAFVTLGAPLGLVTARLVAPAQDAWAHLGAYAILGTVVSIVPASLAGIALSPSIGFSTSLGLLWGFVTALVLIFTTAATSALGWALTVATLELRASRNFVPWSRRPGYTPATLAPA